MSEFDDLAIPQPICARRECEMPVDVAGDQCGGCKAAEAYQDDVDARLRAAALRGRWEVAGEVIRIGNPGRFHEILAVVEQEEMHNVLRDRDQARAAADVLRTRCDDLERENMELRDRVERLDRELAQERSNAVLAGIHGYR